MHELSICSAIADTARDHAGGRSVRAVKLQIGHFRQVVPETLNYCWGLHTKDTDLDACALVVDYIAAVAHCNTCDTDTTLDMPVLRCGRCNGVDVTLVSGEEFLIESIDVVEEVP